MSERQGDRQTLHSDEAGPGGESRLALFEDCASAIDELFQATLASEGEAGFYRFLDSMSRFNNLSAYNAMLVAVQRPGALAVASRRQWQRIGRYPIAGAVPVVVLQPFGPVCFFYEYGDTDGKEIPGSGLGTLFAEGEVTNDQYGRTRTAAERHGVHVVETAQYGSLLAGTAAAIGILPEAVIPQAGNAARYRVRINARHDLPTRFATLAHELGHVYCGHLGGDARGRWPDRSRLSYPEKELEAEAVSWLVCQRTGVATRSKEYLASLISEERIRAVSAYSIFVAANRIEARTAPRR